MKKVTIVSICLMCLILTFGQNANDNTQANNVLRHEFAKRGNHKNELKLGDYVIASVFKSEVNAKQMTEELHKNGFPEASYGYLTPRNMWYIHIAVADDIEKAKTERDKYKKEKIFKSAWLLTVHD